MRQQIKVIITGTYDPTKHEIKVNEFLKSNIELVSVQNNISNGRIYKDGTAQPEIVTTITYKEMFDNK